MVNAAITGALIRASKLEGLLTPLEIAGPIIDVTNASGAAGIKAAGAAAVA